MEIAASRNRASVSFDGFASFPPSRSSSSASSTTSDTSSTASSASSVVGIDLFSRINYSPDTTIDTVLMSRPEAIFNPISAHMERTTFIKPLSGRPHHRKTSSSIRLVTPVDIELRTLPPVSIMSSSSLASPINATPIMSVPGTPSPLLQEAVETFAPTRPLTRERSGVWRKVRGALRW